MSNQSADERIARAQRSVALFDATDDLIAVVGEDDLVLYLSAGWEDILSVPISSILSGSIDLTLEELWAEIIEPESVSRSPHLSSDPESSMLLRIAEPDGRILEGRTVVVFADPRDRIIVFRDVTAAWNALTTLVDNERRFRVVAEASRDMVTETDEMGRFIYVSSACEKVLGYKPEELIGTPPFDLLHPSDVDRFRSEMREGSNSNEPFSVTVHRLKHRDGSHVWVEASALLYRNLEGLQRTVGVARDVTSQIDAEAVRQNLEERVLRGQRLESLGVLAGGIAHDFNNLLTPIIGNVGLALLDLPAESPVRKRIEMIRVAADRATALTRQMLAYSGQGVPSVEAVNITTAIDEMSLLVETTASKSSKIIYELKEDLPFVEVDNTHIGQVLMSLVANSSESFPSTGGRIEIKTGSIDADRAYLDKCFIGENAEPGTYVYLEVIDDGPGIPEVDLDRIFDPFFTTRFTGRGLGLAAVDGIVRGYRGALELASENGQGTRIRVLFPTSVTARGPEQRSEGPPFSGDDLAIESTKGTILVVDDDQDACNLMAEVLARAGFKVIQAAGGAAAVKLFERRSSVIDGVVLDYTMPLVSGGEVFDAIRNIRPDTRILLVSGYARARAADELMKRGLAGFLQKPFIPADLVRNVSLLVETSGGD